MGWKDNDRPTMFVHQIEQEAKVFYHRLIYKLLSDIDNRSPVLTGLFRGNHKVSIGVPDYTFDESKLDTRDEGSVSFNENMAKVDSIPKGTYPKIYIQNNVPYSEDLENGSSTKAPKGVYGLSLQAAREFIK